jgi:putative CocE/NonD family hydrolase
MNFLVKLFSVQILVCAVAFPQALSPVTTASPEPLFKVRHEFNVMVPMRDGIKLAADVSRPDAEGKFPVILARTPYGKFSRAAFEQAEYFAQRGYVYVNQDVRGRYDSEGEFEVLVNEGRDGHDTIEWLARQSWADGNVGTYGGSYLAWDQWLAAEEQPPHLRAMVVQSTPPDIYLTAWWNGAFSINSLFWCLLLDGRVNQELSVYTDPAIQLHLPVNTLDQAFGRRMDKTLHAWIEHATFDEFWKRQAYQDRLSRVTVPVLHVDGWYDFRDVSATLENYNRMIREATSPVAKQNQRVIIGPWAHGNYDHQKLGDIDFGTEAVIDRKALYLKWFDHHLKKKDYELVEAQAPVRIFVMGANRWRDEQEWPLQRARMTPYFFHSDGHANSSAGDGRLTPAAPIAEPVDHYTYDPLDATVLAMGPGESLTADQRKPESRSDMLVFTSEALEAPVEVSGRIRVKLWAGSSAPDTDWVARLVDVHPDGYAQRLTDGIVRARYAEKSQYRRSHDELPPITPGTAREYTLDLWDISNVFLKGHRIRVEIASAYLPIFARNLNTGENSLTSTAAQRAQQTIYHDAAHPSHVVLPVVPR